MSEEDLLMSKEDYLISILNKIWSMIENKPTYEEINNIFPVNDIEKLRSLEMENSKIGIANYGNPFEGVSTLSLFATITDFLCGKRLAIELEIPEDLSKEIEGKDHLTNKQKEKLKKCVVVGFDWA